MNYNMTHDMDFYPLHLILKVESEYTTVSCSDKIKIEKKSVSIEEL